MRYQALDIAKRSLHPISTMLGYGHDIATHPSNPLAHTRLGRLHAAVLESTQRLIKHYPKRGFEFGTLEVEGRALEIRERIVRKKPFCHLLHFERDGCETAPKVLFVAALSGHHASLSRETVQEFLPDHDVYITDWLDAKQVPLADGRFGFEEYVAYLIEFLEMLGPDTHVVGLCQASVPALVAAAVMAKHANPARPKTLTLVAGPIDITANHNAVTQYVDKVNMDLMRMLTLQRVPKGYPGEGRMVYPGYLQLGGFMTMNLTSHLEKHWQFFVDLARGNVEAADKHRDFYDDYFSILDGTAEFYVETLERIFLNQHLPKGLMTYAGERVDCTAITDIPLLTVEGANDDMVNLGVTEAAHGICSALPDELRDHHVQEGVGHYGVFSGSRYREEVAPRMKAFMARHGGSAARASTPKPRRRKTA